MFDFQRAFKFFTNDSQWATKFITGGFLLLIPVLVSYVRQYLPDDNSKLIVKYLPILIPAIIISLIFSAIVAGYRFKLINNEILYNDLKLPAWGAIIDYFVLAFKAAAGSAAWIVLAGVLVWFVMIPFGALYKINALLLLVPIILVSSIIISLLVVLPLLNASYCVDLKFNSFFNMQRLKKLIKGNVLKYFVYGVILFALSALQQILAFVLGLTVIGILFVPFLTFYFTLVSADITAQFIVQTGVVPAHCEIGKES